MAAMTNIEELKGFLAQPRRIIITSHINPDGDAMGSSLGLYNYLQPLGHKVSVVVPSNYPDFLKWMPNDGKVYIYPYQQSEAQRLIAEAELIFCLDYNALGRIGDVGTAVAANPCPKVLIDHHLFPDDFARYVLHRVDASSTAELVYEFFEQLGVAYKVTADIAACSLLAPLFMPKEYGINWGAQQDLPKELKVWMQSHHNDLTEIANVYSNNRNSSL